MTISELILLFWLTLKDPIKADKLASQKLNMKLKISVQEKPENLTAYFLGALRDGCFIKNEKNSTYRIRIYQKNKEWIDNLAKMSVILFGKKPTVSIDERDCVWSLMINSKEIFEKVCELSNYPGSQKEWNTPKIVLNSSLETKIEYVRGFFDAEGGVPHVEKGWVENKNVRIHFTQCNKKCLDELKQIVSDLGIKMGKVCGPYFKKGYKTTVYRLKIHGIWEVVNFFDKIGSLHPEKNHRLSLIKKRIQVEA